MSQTLLVPLDGTESGEAALPWATRLARARGLALVLVRVLSRPFLSSRVTVGGYMTPEGYDHGRATDREVATAYLERVRERVLAEDPSASSGPAVETAVREGDPARNLLDLADEVGAYAIAMPGQGHGGLTDLVLGSVAERVVHHATIPVLIVPAPTEQPPAAPALGRLLVPLDGSTLAERALDVAGEIAEPETSLAIVRVAAPVTREVRGDEGPVRFVDEEATQRVVAATAEYLGRVAEGLSARWSTWTGVRVGEPVEEILAAAQDQAADLIVMATHGNIGPARWFLGSVAEQVVRRSDRPVLLVSARAVAARAAGAFAVHDVMTRDPATVREDEPLVAALRTLLERQVSGAPVVNAAGELVGVISEHDLLEWQADLVDRLTAEPPGDPAEYARRLESETVGQVMSRPARTIEESASLSEAIRLFRERRNRRLPVTSGDRLVGIVTRGDVLKAMGAQWERSTGADEPAEAGMERAGNPDEA